MAFSYGGQAVLEGVMIRGRTAVSVAVRSLEGDIITHVEPLPTLKHSLWSHIPIIRGVLAVGDMLRLGTRMLMFSAAISMGSPDEAAALDVIDHQRMAPTVGVSSLLAVSIFLVLPALLAQHLRDRPHRRLAGGLTEAAIRLGVFLGYIVAMSLLPTIRRVFAYHGAEHKTVHAVEHGESLDSATIQRFPTAHPRCGTAFLLQTMVVSSLLFATIGQQRTWQGRVAIRVFSTPIVAGLSYELLRGSARFQNRWPVRALTAPGLLLQALTTRQPSDDQVEVAIAAMQAAIAADAGAEQKGSIHA